MLFYIGVTSSSDIEIFCGDEYRILFRRGRWYFLDTKILSKSIVNSLDATSSEPWRVFYSLSKVRKGAAALFVEDNMLELYKEIVVGHVSKEKEMFEAVGNGIMVAAIERLCETGELFRLLTTDGMTMFSSKFDSVYDFSVIVDTSTGEKSKGCKENGGGGRTTAVCAGSKYGRAIKVSEDGPISVYYNEEKIYQIG